MGRNCISRYVQSTPPVKGFRPFGRLAGKRDSVVLTLDEYEAIRLLDYEHHTQEEAAVQMRVSRPTLTRIYERARIKYATALVEGCLLLIGGGDVKLRRHSYLCQDCGTELESPEQSLTDCPRCTSSRVVSLDNCHQSQCSSCRKCRRGQGRGRHRSRNNKSKQQGV